ncbi:conserved hypothetical protein [Hyella patelloides LEGE 07179]|uniref:DUF1963 domain-containing protein n=1 Tax=Hyella patelloides LEGE 07179 TaxID=945734 RepID=A0A563VZW0_9CYAN|nr:YwqG family protein [Hyella patelloides]VEP16969.1 conserved hypothetical protein [Hyella patelloides LEGE 07179]
MIYKLDVELSPDLEPYRAKIEATIKPYIEIRLTDNNQPNWWQSKFGGLPYLPKGFTYPKSYDGEYLYLLAQINFVEVPHLEYFPNKGILQFYIAADEELYGLNFDNPTQQDKFRAVYFPDIDLKEDNLVTDFDFLPKLNDEWLMPFEGCCSLDFTINFRPITISDNKFSIFPVDEADANFQDIVDEYYDKFCMNKHKLGGYPNFVQYDPRYNYPQDEEPYILLLQIDSDSSKSINICWGDGGIGNFFIKKSALERLDFSNVWYNWDCG